MIAGVALPISAVGTSATTAVSTTHTVTPIITATAIVTTVKTTATTVPITTVATTATSTTQPPRGYIAAGFSGDIVEGPAPLAVQFTDQSSGGPDTWSWSFGDGSTGTAQNPSHTYLYPGTYSVTLTVRNPSGATDTFFEDSYITVNNPVTVTETVTTQTTTLAVDNTITAGFRGTPVTGPSPLNVVFTDSSTGSPSSWYWDFGDGTQSTRGKPVTHVHGSRYLYCLFNRNRPGWHQGQETHELYYGDKSVDTGLDTDTSPGYQ